MYADLPEPPVEDALVEDAGLGWGPHPPHQLVGLHVGTSGAASHAGLVRAACRSSLLELQTTTGEDFTITEKAPNIGPFPG